MTHLVLLHLQLLPGTSRWRSSGLVPTGHEGGRLFWHKSSQDGTPPMSGIKLQVQFFVQLLRIYVAPGSYTVLPSIHWERCPKVIGKSYKINSCISDTKQKLRFPCIVPVVNVSKFLVSGRFVIFVKKKKTLGEVFQTLYIRTEYSNTFAKENDLITFAVNNFHFLKQTWFLHSSLRTWNMYIRASFCKCLKYI